MGTSVKRGQPGPAARPPHRRGQCGAAAGEAAGVATPGQQHPADPVCPGIAAEYPPSHPGRQDSKENQGSERGQAEPGNHTRRHYPGCHLPGPPKHRRHRPDHGTAPRRRGAATQRVAAEPLSPAGPRTPTAAVGPRRPARSPIAPSGTPRHTGYGRHVAAEGWQWPAGQPLGAQPA